MNRMIPRLLPKVFLLASGNTKFHALACWAESMYLCIRIRLINCISETYLTLYKNKAFNRRKDTTEPTYNDQPNTRRVQFPLCTM